jgi:hypothetical protein
MEFIIALAGLAVALVMILSARKRHRRGPPEGGSRDDSKG